MDNPFTEDMLVKAQEFIDSGMLKDTDIEGITDAKALLDSCVGALLGVFEPNYYAQYSGNILIGDVVYKVLVTNDFSITATYLKAVDVDDYERFLYLAHKLVFQAILTVEEEVGDYSFVRDVQRALLSAACHIGFTIDVDEVFHGMTVTKDDDEDEGMPVGEVTPERFKDIPQNDSPQVFYVTSEGSVTSVSMDDLLTFDEEESSY